MSRATGSGRGASPRPPCLRASVVNRLSLPSLEPEVS